MATVVNNDVNSINWARGLTDPGEMLECGYLPEARRQDGESDGDYQKRLMATLPAKLVIQIRDAAIARAGLDTTGGVVSLMVAGEPAWSGLGVNVSDSFTSAEALEGAKLGWRVGMWPSFAHAPDGEDSAGDVEMILAEEARHVVRLDSRKVLGTVGTRYTPFQNEDCFALLDALVGEKLAMFHTAGAINGGRTVWMQCKVPAVYYASKDDYTESFILLANSHDGSSALSIMPTTLRAVCKNTLRLAMKNGGREKVLNIRHSESLKERVEDAKDHLGLVTKRLEKYGGEMKELAAAPATDRQVREYAQEWFPTKVRPAKIKADDPAIQKYMAEQHPGGFLDALVDSHGNRTEVVQELLEGHFAESERAASHNRKVLELVVENFEKDPARGTAWGMFNAVTAYTDHQMTNRGKDKESARLSSAWFGRGDEIKQEALVSALAFAR